MSAIQWRSEMDLQLKPASEPLARCLMWASWERSLSGRKGEIDKDASPPCSGHGGLTPGLGDRRFGWRRDHAQEDTLRWA
jgi:hypothetical protein